jgi:hypothetical protein
MRIEIEAVSQGAFRSRGYRVVRFEGDFFSVLGTYATLVEAQAKARRLTETTLRCGFCGAEATHNEAYEAGWTPEFWLDDERSAERPACESCAAPHLDDLGGDPIVKPGHQEALATFGEPEGGNQ